jgi:ABC-type nickel/cobalt efflux system permease component RcnA
MRIARRLFALGLAGFVAVAFPAVVLAHPLGNFTINHYAGIRVAADGVSLDIVIDRAEIPTFQIRREVDADGDGDISAAELDGLRRSGCADVATGLELTGGGSAMPLQLTAAGVDFPMGNAGLPTMRLVCEFEARFAGPLAASTTVTFADRYLSERIGWREIVVSTDGTTASGDLPPAGTSERLTHYPVGQLAAARDEKSVAFSVTPGGPALAPFVAPDATPVDVASQPSPSARAPASASPLPTAAPTAARNATPSQGAVPGGVERIPSALLVDTLDPVVVLVALATAALLGIGHALTPGHGKTLIAAYLVGRRGSPVHALVLALSVSASHTLGILALAVLVVAAEHALPPDTVVRAAPVIAASTIVVIGGWMLITEARRWRARTATLATDDHDDADHDHVHEHGRVHEHDALVHSHGGVRHSHAPAIGSTISWRSLFVLGLAGGLVPSTNALLILLGTIAAGRPAWGVVLVIAFGVGMAMVMAGIGLAFVYARGFLERLPARPALGRAMRLAPIGAAVVVLGLGLVLTTQAIASPPVL